MSSPSAPLPLSGITVVDLSHLYNGPYATFLLAQAGARVIKVEPLHGELLRSRGDDGDAQARLPFAMLNMNKEPVALDLKQPEGQALLHEMAARADVVVENFAPGTMDRLGLGAAALRAANPRLVYGCSSGYGRDGPYRDYPAVDVVVQAMVGVMSSTGFPGQKPVKAGAALCDFLAGVHLFGAIVTALYEREHTGVGRVVEVTMQDAAYCSLASNLGGLHHHGGKHPERTGNRHGGLGISPYNVYRTTDGHVVVNAPSDRHFQSVLDVLGWSDIAHDPRFATRAARVENYYLVDELIEGWTRTLATKDVVRRMLAAKVPCAPVRELAEVVDDENMHARGSLQRMEHPDLGPIVALRSPLVFEGSPRGTLDPIGRPGASNEAVLGGWLGHAPDEISALRSRSVIA